MLGHWVRAETSHRGKSEKQNKPLLLAFLEVLAINYTFRRRVFGGRRIGWLVAFDLVVQLSTREENRIGCTCELKVIDTRRLRGRLRMSHWSIGLRMINLGTTICLGMLLNSTGAVRIRAGLVIGVTRHKCIWMGRAESWAAFRRVYFISLKLIQFALQRHQSIRQLLNRLLGLL